MDLTSKAAEGVRNTTRTGDLLRRVRPPRVHLGDQVSPPCRAPCRISPWERCVQRRESENHTTGQTENSAGAHAAASPPAACAGVAALRRALGARVRRAAAAARRRVARAPIHRLLRPRRGRGCPRLGPVSPTARASA